MEEKQEVRCGHCENDRDPIKDRWYMWTSLVREAPSPGSMILDHVLHGLGWMTAQPYDGCWLDSKKLEQLRYWIEECGLDMYFTGESSHYPGRTVLVVFVVRDFKKYSIQLLRALETAIIEPEFIEEAKRALARLESRNSGDLFKEAVQRTIIRKG